MSNMNTYYFTSGLKEKPLVQFGNFKDYEEKWAIADEEFDGGYSIDRVICQGPDEDLFYACGCAYNEKLLELWFNDIEPLPKIEKAALYFLVEGKYYPPRTAIRLIENVHIVESILYEAAIELFDECYLSDIPEPAQHYIDYDAFAADCSFNGDMYEFQYGNTTYTVTNANTL